MNPFLIALAVAPALIISYLIYRIDKFDRESHWQLIICFMLGMLITFPAMKLEAIGDAYGFEESDNLWVLLVLAYIVVGLTEELVKFVALMLYGYPRKEFNEPLDGIVYAVMIAMGFATLENIIYADRFGLSTIVLRAFTAVPAHAVFAVMMGYYVGLAKFDKANRLKFILIGLGLPVLVHGTYDFFILQEYYDWLMGFATLTLFISIYFSIKLIKLHQQNSPFKETENAEPITAKEPEIEDATIVPHVEAPNEIMDAVITELENEEETSSETEEEDPEEKV